MTVTDNRVIHRFIRDISEYEYGGEYYAQVLPLDIQVYAIYTKPSKNGLFYVIGDGLHTYTEIRDGKGKSFVYREYAAMSLDALVEIRNLIEDEIITREESIAALDEAIQSKLDKKDVSKVAITGSYNDLKDKPIIPGITVASQNILGSIKVGTTLSIEDDGLMDIKGGWREVDRYDDLLGIPMKQKSIGMAVYVRNEQQVYVLEKGEDDLERWSKYLPDVKVKTYVFEQATASSVWEIVHNLGKRPSVTVVDSTCEEVVGDVTYIDDNKLIIKFKCEGLYSPDRTDDYEEDECENHKDSQGFKGFAYLN
jgi:hypothetical protein